MLFLYLNFFSLSLSQTPSKESTEARVIAQVRFAPTPPSLGTRQ